MGKNWSTRLCLALPFLFADSKNRLVLNAACRDYRGYESRVLSSMALLEYSNPSSGSAIDDNSLVVPIHNRFGIEGLHLFRSIAIWIVARPLPLVSTHLIDPILSSVVFH